MLNPGFEHSGCNLNKLPHKAERILIVVTIEGLSFNYGKVDFDRLHSIKEKVVSLVGHSISVDCFHLKI